MTEEAPKKPGTTKILKEYFGMRPGTKLAAEDIPPHTGMQFDVVADKTYRHRRDVMGELDLPSNLIDDMEKHLRQGCGFIIVPEFPKQVGRITNFRLSHVSMSDMPQLEQINAWAAPRPVETYEDHGFIRHRFI